MVELKKSLCFLLPPPKRVCSIRLKCVKSTNTWVKENYQSCAHSHITRVIADEQLGGRGRFTRRWVSPRGGGIYLTYFFTLPKEGRVLHNLTQLLALSAAKLLKYNKLNPAIKWPNDILVSGKKIGGILCETLDLGNRHGIVLGVGINVNMKREMLDTIDRPATSLYIETGQAFFERDLLRTLEAYFFPDLSLFMRKGFTPFYRSYNDLLMPRGKLISIRQNDRVVAGRFHSLNFDGRLNLLLPSGEVKGISSGEIIQEGHGAECERGDLNPQEELPSLPPQGSVSTDSTTSAKRS